MRPNFALIFAHDGIELLQRSSPGWLLVDEVSFDEADLGAAIDRLRKAGLALDPSGIRAKLVIPNDQIRYIAVTTPGPMQDSRRAELVEAGLDGATPYNLNELAYAWSVAGDITHVAAVARETLDEAEEFARRHGITPISFVAIPDDQNFLGEPFFGAASSLPPGTEVERDATRIRVLGRAPLPEMPVEDANAPAPDLAAAAAVLSPAAETAQPVALQQADAPDAAGPGTIASLDAHVAPDGGDIHSGRKNDDALEGDLPDDRATAQVEPSADEKSVQPEEHPAPDLRPAETEGEASTEPETTRADGEAAEDDTAASSPSADAGAATTGEEPADMSLAADASTNDLVEADLPTATEDPASEITFKARRTDAPVGELLRDDPAPRRPAPGEGAFSFASVRAGDAAADVTAAGVRDSAPATASTLPGQRRPSGAAPSFDLVPGGQPDLSPRIATHVPTAPIEDSGEDAMRRIAASIASLRPGTAEADGLPDASAPGAFNRSGRLQTRERQEVSTGRFGASGPAETGAATTLLGRGTIAAAINGISALAVGQRIAGGLSALRQRRSAAAEPPKVVPQAPSIPARRDDSAEITTLSSTNAAAPLFATRGAETAEPVRESEATADAARPAEAALTPGEAEAAPAAPGTAAGTWRRVTNGFAVKGAGVEGQQTEAEREAERMTIFGERGQSSGRRGHGGLKMLAAMIAAIAVAVALWAIAFRDAAQTDLVAALPEGETVAASATGAAPAPDADTTAEADDLAAVAPQSAAPDAGNAVPLPQSDAPAATIEPLDSGATRPAPATPAEAEARYAATGIWQRAPLPTTAPIPGEVGETGLFRFAGRAPVINAVALPETGELGYDVRPDTPAAPPPYGMEFDLDAAGNVRATEDGARTADGHLAYTGRPAVTPPPRPGSTAIAPEAQAVPAAVPAAPPAEPSANAGDAIAAEDEPGAAAQDALPDGLVPATPDGAIAPEGHRVYAGDPATTPPARPEETLAAQDEAATLSAEPPADALAAAIVEAAAANAQALLRPRLRPSSIGPEPEDDAAEAEEEADADADAAEIDGTAQAVEESLKPRARPGDFGQMVAAARTAPAAPAARIAPAAPAAAVVPQTVTPSIPSSASVSQAATVPKAINLRQLNLIGVYGDPSNRTALIRLPNGTYHKVKVGDRLDGGQIAAIGDSALRYVKGNRSMLLQMPGS